VAAVLADFTLETFLPLVRTTFQVRAAEDRCVSLVLLEATGHGPDGNPFVLRFGGPADEFLPQGTYAFEHDGLGAFDLFVSPSSRTADGFTTEAVFNQIRGQIRLKTAE
jgi:hypothetical protein